MIPGSPTDTMSDELIREILNTLGLSRSDRWFRLCRPLFQGATRRLSQIALTFDRLIEERGLPRAADWSLTNWCRDIQVRRKEKIPQEGPLLVISNHPGAYDALVIAAQLPRPDLRIIASDLPFLRKLKNFSQRTFYIPINKTDAWHRMSGLLSAIHYLKDGGAVLLMGSGTIDPDPAVYPGALGQLERWTEAVNIFLRFVPQTRLLLSAVSHVVSPKWALHPLTWLKRAGLDRRRLAEFGQVLQQLFLPGSLYVSPCLSFSRVLSASEISDSPRLALIEMESVLLKEHCREFGGKLP
jgi:hypothetical protein